MQQKKRKPQRQQTKPDTHVAQVTKAEPVENKQQDKQRLDPELYAPLPMKHQTTAYNKAKIHRKMRNGVMCIKKLSEITGIAEADILPVFIEFKPDK